jgi:hypothetical protein
MTISAPTEKGERENDLVICSSADDCHRITIVAVFSVAYCGML